VRFGPRVTTKSNWNHSIKCLVFCLLFSFNVLAQSPESEVHIAPLKKTPIATANDPNTQVAKSAHDESVLKTHEKPIKVDVDLVLVNVTVTDSMNRLVTGLEKENFALTEVNIAQEIKHFASEDAPISLGVIFDISGSMSNKIDKSKQAVVEFFKTANIKDEFFVITVSDKPQLLADFTSSIEDVQGKLAFTVPRGRTALLDAVYLGINKMHEAKYPKKALLIISDGGDNRSRYTDNEIKNLVREADVQIYAIGIFDNNYNTPEEIRGPFLLGELTDATGGRTFTIGDVNELSDVASKIGVELRNQYVLGYRPTNPEHDGRWRKIKVKLIPPRGLPPLFVHAKTGYYAPQP
jgi:Ca-activated chloride channel family protein